uniref:hypothetical protein n=1 Tax=Actinokineospora sp. CA-119265 TaxID=3239890 RepID=UPI003F498A3A
MAQNDDVRAKNSPTGWLVDKEKRRAELTDAIGGGKWSQVADEHRSRAGAALETVESEAHAENARRR